MTVSLGSLLLCQARHLAASPPRWMLHLCPLSTSGSATPVVPGLLEDGPPSSACLDEAYQLQHKLEGKRLKQVVQTPMFIDMYTPSNLEVQELLDVLNTFRYSDYSIIAACLHSDLFYCSFHRTAPVFPMSQEANFMPERNARSQTSALNNLRRTPAHRRCKRKSPAGRKPAICSTTASSARDIAIAHAWRHACDSEQPWHSHN